MRSDKLGNDAVEDKGGLQNSPDDASVPTASAKWAQGGLSGRSVPTNHRADWITAHAGKIAVIGALVGIVAIVLFLSRP